MATPTRPTFDTLPPELRLQIYSHHLSSLVEDLPVELQRSIRAQDHAVFDPPLLRTSHAFRDEMYPLYLKSLRQAQGIIHDLREETQAKLQRGECFAWDKSSKSFMGGCSGAFSPFQVYSIRLSCGFRGAG